MNYGQLVDYLKSAYRATAQTKSNYLIDVVLPAGTGPEGFLAKVQPEAPTMKITVVSFNRLNRVLRIDLDIDTWRGWVVPWEQQATIANPNQRGRDNLVMVVPFKGELPDTRGYWVTIPAGLEIPAAYKVPGRHEVICGTDVVVKFRYDGDGTYRGGCELVEVKID